MSPHPIVPAYNQPHGAARKSSAPRCEPKCRVTLSQSDRMGPEARQHILTEQRSTGSGVQESLKRSASDRQGQERGGRTGQTIGPVRRRR